MEMNNDIFTPDLPIPEPVSFEDAPISAPVEDEKPTETPPPRRRHKANAPVLTIESGDEIETEDAREAAAWHEIHNAYRTRRILSAPLGGIEQTDSGKTIAVVDYNGFRIAIPLKEMMVAPTAANSTDSMAVRQMKLLGNMLGAEIDFVILGIDSKSRSVVASRREAMMRKRQLFYFSPDANGEYRVREGRVVQARVIAVADKSIRVEIFGVECSIMARDLAWDWIGDAHDRFAVGDQILVRVTEVNKTSQEDLSVRADVKSVTENTRVSYPIDHIKNIVRPISSAPAAKNVIFLSADAFGVLPPVSILTPEQTQYYFLSGFTAKLAGTERGITEPTPTFSACFGQAFLELHPTKYAEELVKKMQKSGAKAYLVNTGWNGSGKRISIKDTRGIIDAILNGDINNVPTKKIPYFDFEVPTELNGVDTGILDPRDTYADASEWETKAKDLAARFIKNFSKYEGNAAGKALVSAGPQL